MRYSDREKNELQLFLNQLQLSVPEANSDWPHFVRDAVSYIHQNVYNNELKVARLREDIYGCNGNIFSTDFTYFVGAPPSVYINDLRIEAAKHVLADKRFSNTNILTIAKELGFSGKGNFHHAFRKREGVSPGTWRKRKLLART